MTTTLNLTTTTETKTLTVSAIAQTVTLNVSAGEAAPGVSKSVQIIVKEAADLAGALDSTKVYFVDGVIDMGAQSIEVPAGGLNLIGATFDTSKLISAADNHTLFTSPLGGSGNLLLDTLGVEVTGASSQVFALASATGFEAIEITQVNFNNCSSLGYLDNYRQFLELGTGRFGGSPELEFRGVWNGARVSTSIARNLTIPTALFKTGAGLTFSGRFVTDINCDLPATGALLDFAPANFLAKETLKLSGAFLTRQGVANASDTTISPNIDQTSVKSFWQDNVGVKNTHKYIQARIIAEVPTAIAAASTYYDLAGTFGVLDSSHLAMVSNGVFELLSGSGRYSVSLNFTVKGSANDVFSIQASKSTDSGATWVPVDHKIAKIQNFVGNADIGALGSTFNLDMSEGDRLLLEVENYTAARDLTAELDSSITITQL